HNIDGENTFVRENQLDLGRGPILPLLFKMSWPSIVAMSVMAIYQVNDAFWIARLSHEALAALTICFPIQAMILSIGIGTGIGAGSFASRMFGAGRNMRAGQAAGQTILVSLCLGVLLILLVEFHAETILVVFGATGEIIPLAGQYLRILVIGAPFLFILFISNNLIRAEGKPKLSMFIVLTWAITASILTPFLIFGGIFPKMGLSGAAAAAVTAQILTAAISLYLLARKNSLYRLSWRHLAPDLEIIAATYKTGFPTIVMNMIMSLILILFNHVLSGYGATALAIMGLCFRINSLVMMVVFAVGHGVLPIVGYNEGARLRDRVRETVKVAVTIAITISWTSYALIFMLARPILSLFLPDPLMLSDAVTALRIYVTMLIFAGPIFIWINTFIGLGRGATAMFLMMIRDVFVVVPLIYYLPSWFGLNGVWLTQPAANGIAFFVIYLWIKRTLAKMPRDPS
ncbi:MAG: MATE family efflux transporter, partial [Smithellaceae bacterium]|nr:MATE family efflux transporter [Smithellaceae bacterium]